MNTQDFKKGMPMNPHWNIDTKLVHAGERGEVLPGTPTVHPISMSNTYIAPLATMDAILGGAPGYTYGRHHNPSVDALAEAVRELEEGEVAFAYASGMAAVHASLMALSLRPGDRVLLSRDLYGASLNLVEQLFAPMGIEAIEEDLTDLDRVNQVLIRHRPRLVLFELISNPLLRLVDGPALTQMAHQHQARVIIDNTFTTPLMAKPLSYGADFVVHSATKYLGGHGDAIGGILVTRREHQDRLYSQQKLMGTILGPFEAWLIHRGLKTLGLRFPRQCQNASQLALRLHQSGRFKQVHYPGLTHHPEYRQAQTFFPQGLLGAVVTLDLPGDKAMVFKFLEALQLVVPATTVGDIYTLALYPLIASHRSQSAEARQAMGISDGTVRIAVGIESVEDIAADILAAAAWS